MCAWEYEGRDFRDCERSRREERERAY